MAKTTFWCLYNSDDQSQHTGLEIAEARAMLRLIPRDQHYLWYGWQEGWTDWLPVDKCADLKPVQQEMGSRPPMPPPAEENTPTPSVVHIDPSKRRKSDSRRKSDDNRKTNSEGRKEQPVFEPEPTGQEIIFEDPTFIARKFARVRKKIKVEIECKGKRFASYTQDISLGGVCLIDPLPAWIVGYCQIRLIQPSSSDYIDLTCSIVENQRPDSRYRVELFPLEKIEKFQSWLRTAA
jgi:hypothetical protein